jgi:hypothetical protein
MLLLRENFGQIFGSFRLAFVGHAAERLRNSLTFDQQNFGDRYRVARGQLCTFKGISGHLVIEILVCGVFGSSLLLLFPLCFPSQFCLPAKLDHNFSRQVELRPCHYGICIRFNDHELAMVIDMEVAGSRFLRIPATSFCGSTSTIVDCGFVRFHRLARVANREQRSNTKAICFDFGLIDFKNRECR